jgi:hypothetical protein
MEVVCPSKEDESKKRRQRIQTTWIQQKEKVMNLLSSSSELLELDFKIKTM